MAMSAARKKSTASKRAPAAKTAAKKSAAKKQPAKRAAAKSAPRKASATKASVSKASVSKGSSLSRSAKSKSGAASSPKTAPKNPTGSSTNSSSSAPQAAALPKPRFNKDGLGYTKDFELAFVKEQYEALQDERIRLTGQAMRLEEEAHQLVEEAEMGDVQFDDEGGEGDTMVVERERDLALSAQAREAVSEIDAALSRIAAGTYGYSVVSGLPLPKERLEAIPWADVLVEEKVGGIGRR